MKLTIAKLQQIIQEEIQEEIEEGWMANAAELYKKAWTDPVGTAQKVARRIDPRNVYKQAKKRVHQATAPEKKVRPKVKKVQKPGCDPKVQSCPDLKNGTGN